MQDRPTYEELLAAVERFLEEDVMPGAEGSRRFNARVAANALRIVRRELEHEGEHLTSEWSGLNALLGEEDAPGDHAALREGIRRRSGELCERIRRGEADGGAFREAVVTHVRRTVRDKLLVSNPGWLGEGEKG